MKNVLIILLQVMIKNMMSIFVENVIMYILMGDVRKIVQQDIQTMKRK